MERRNTTPARIWQTSGYDVSLCDHMSCGHEHCGLLHGRPRNQLGSGDLNDGHRSAPLPVLRICGVVHGGRRCAPSRGTYAGVDLVSDDVPSAASPARGIDVSDGTSLHGLRR